MSVIGNSKGTTLSLEDTLGDEAGFEQLMQHLAREWCMEALLAYVEMTQLQQAVRTELQSDGMAQLLGPQRALLHNPGVPASHIVHCEDVSALTVQYGLEKQQELDKLGVVKLSAYLLYKKYVDHAELQINISHRQRQAMAESVGAIRVYLEDQQVTAESVFSLYSGVISELYTLLKDSHMRFKRLMVK